MGNSPLDIVFSRLQSAIGQRSNPLYDHSYINRMAANYLTEEKAYLQKEIAPQFITKKYSDLLSLKRRRHEDLAIIEDTEFSSPKILRNNDRVARRDRSKAFNKNPHRAQRVYRNYDDSCSYSYIGNYSHCTNVEHYIADHRFSRNGAPIGSIKLDQVSVTDFKAPSDTNEPEISIDSHHLVDSERLKQLYIVRRFRTTYWIIMLSIIASLIAYLFATKDNGAIQTRTIMLVILSPIIDVSIGFIHIMILSAKGIVKRANTLCIDHPFEKKIKRDDSNFSLQVFLGEMNNSVNALHFANSYEDTAQFCNKDLSHIISKYYSVVECFMKSVHFNNYTVNSDFRCIELTATFYVISVKNNCIYNELEKANIRMIKNKFANSEMPEYDWVIDEYNI